MANIQIFRLTIKWQTMIKIIMDFVGAVEMLMTAVTLCVLAGKQHSSMYASADKDAVLPILSGHASG